MKCIENIKDITLDCQYRPTKGLKHRVLVIPYKDIDRRYTTMNDDKSVITHFQLYPTKRGYLFELPNAFKLNGLQKLSGGFVHELSIKIDKANSDNIATMNALTKGTYVLVVETNGNTFEVLGYEAGVVVSSIQRDYAGNVIGLTFTTPSDVKELRMIALWEEGDYLTMSKKFERKAFVGENLLKNSGRNITNNYHRIATYLLTEELKDENLVTLSIKAQLGYLGSWIEVYNAGTYLTSLTKINGVFTSSFFWKTNASPSNLIIYVLSGNGTNNTIEWAKLERGNKPTDWTPANEDE